MAELTPAIEKLLRRADAASAMIDRLIEYIDLHDMTGGPESSHDVWERDYWHDVRDELDSAAAAVRFNA